MEMKRDFKGIWIPKEIYLNRELNWTDKILLIEIDSLDTEEHCYASNEYFSEFLGVSIRAISTSINKLKSLGYIEEVDFDGRKRTLKSNIHSGMKQTSNEPGSLLLGRHEENFYHNNIDNNIDNNNTPYISPKKKNKDNKTVESYENEFNEFFDVYPRQRRGSKQKAHNAWNKALKREDITPEQIIQATKKYAISEDVAKGYAKGCEAWLNGSCFLNEYKSRDISGISGTNPLIEYMLSEYEPNEITDNIVLKDRYIKQHSRCANDLLNACGGDIDEAKRMIVYYVKNIFPQQNKQEFYLWDVLNNFCRIHEALKRRQ